VSYQLEHRVSDAAALPPTLLDLDAAFTPPELAVDPAQRAFLLSRRGALRNRARFIIRTVRKNPRAAGRWIVRLVGTQQARRAIRRAIAAALRAGGRVPGLRQMPLARAAGRAIESYLRRPARKADRATG
jgi:hypothetical protein